MKKPKLIGKRILMRMYEKEDSADFFKNIKDKEISRWSTNIPYPYSKKRAEKFIKITHKRFKEKTHVNVGIVLKKENRVIGSMGLNKIDWKNRKSEIGYWLGKKYWGKGIATEALLLFLEYAFEKIKLHRVSAHVLEVNKQSARVLEKCGFRLEGTEKESKLVRNTWHNVKIYAILQEEFLRNKKLSGKKRLQKNT